MYPLGKNIVGTFLVSVVILVNDGRRPTQDCLSAFTRTSWCDPFRTTHCQTNLGSEMHYFSENWRAISLVFRSRVRPSADRLYRGWVRPGEVSNGRRAVFIQGDNAETVRDQRPLKFDRVWTSLFTEQLMVRLCKFTVNNIYSIHCRHWNVNSWAEQLQESVAALCSEPIFARCLECSPWVEYLGNQ